MSINEVREGDNMRGSKFLKVTCFTRISQNNDFLKNYIYIYRVAGAAVMPFPSLEDAPWEKLDWSADQLYRAVIRSYRWWSIVLGRKSGIECSFSPSLPSAKLAQYKVLASTKYTEMARFSRANLSRKNNWHRSTTQHILHDSVLILSINHQCNDLIKQDDSPLVSPTQQAVWTSNKFIRNWW